jgi:hypothetical protein
MRRPGRARSQRQTRPRRVLKFDLRILAGWLNSRIAQTAKARQFKRVTFPAARWAFCCKCHDSHDLANRGARGRFQSAPPSRSGFFRDQRTTPYMHHTGAAAFSGELEKERGALRQNSGIEKASCSSGLFMVHL